MRYDLICFTFESLINMLDFIDLMDKNNSTNLNNNQGAEKDTHSLLLDELKLRFTTSNFGDRLNIVCPNQNQSLTTDQNLPSPGVQRERSTGSSCIVQKTTDKLLEALIIDNSDTTTDISDLDNENDRLISEIEINNEEEITDAPSIEEASVRESLNTNYVREIEELSKGRAALKSLWEQLMTERNEHHKTVYTLQSLQNMYYTELQKNAQLQNTIDKLRFSEGSSLHNSRQNISKFPETEENIALLKMTFEDTTSLSADDSVFSCPIDINSESKGSVRKGSLIDLSKYLPSLTVPETNHPTLVCPKSFLNLSECVMVTQISSPEIKSCDYKSKSDDPLDCVKEVSVDQLDFVKDVSVTKYQLNTNADPNIKDSHKERNCALNKTDSNVATLLSSCSEEFFGDKTKSSKLVDSNCKDVQVRNKIRLSHKLPCAVKPNTKQDDRNYRNILQLYASLDVADRQSSSLQKRSKEMLLHLMQNDKTKTDS